MAATLNLCSDFFCKSKNASGFQPMELLRRQQCLHFTAPPLSVSPSLPSVSGHCMSLRLRCEGGRADVLERSDTQSRGSDQAPSENELTCVMKFGGSSVASAERMREVAGLILSFPDERPVVVLSAMGKTTNKLLSVFVELWFFRYLLLLTCFLIMRLVLQAGEKSVTCGVSNVSDLEELAFIKELHLRFFWLYVCKFSIFYRKWFSERVLLRCIQDCG